MNKYLITTIALLIYALSFSQGTEEDKVRQTIVDFFDAFHKQDTLKLKALAKGNIIMQSISVAPSGKTRLDENDYYGFVSGIASIPKDKMFEEKLLSYEIKIDGKMANAWTDYEFWYDEKFSHCGVNSFQLIKEEETWKIIYLVDTRRRERCKN